MKRLHTVLVASLWCLAGFGAFMLLSDVAEAGSWFSYIGYDGGSVGDWVRSLEVWGGCDE